jgi:hypothetical protein
MALKSCKVSNFVALIVVVFVGSVLLSIFSGKSGPNPKIEACVSKGVAYFKEIDSYPTLKSFPNVDSAAEDVARERCSRTTRAFGNI